MLRRIKFLPLVAVAMVLLGSCKLMSKKEEEKAAAPVPEAHLVDGHPDWIMQGNVYEVNVRQYTPEGTFAAFQKHLDRLKDMGVQTLWFMPINPIGKLDRKGVLGSYYAVSDYKAVNPEFGSMEEWKTLVNTAHEKGFKVIIDWVPNHTSPDHGWITSHPAFYVKDSTGKAAVAFDWADTRQLDYSNNEMRDSMIAAMKFWITETHIDGFRCDVAWNVPGDFWKPCIASLRAVDPNIFMLAEADKKYLHPSGFDATYPWDMFHMMVKVAKGQRPAFALDSIVGRYDTLYPKNGLLLYFTSNHDENSWNKADYGTMPGPIHAPFAVFTQTMLNSVPLVYSGQEEPVLDSLSFFYKDTITFKALSRARFYKTLLELRKQNPALAANASFRKVAVGNENGVYAYVREAGGKKVFVILNLSAKEQSIRVTDPTLLGEPYNVFMGTKEPLKNTPWNIEPWGYVIYTY